ncbi:MAG: FeoA domain-containing protein [Spirochaetales bacterium]|nr:FeoA domain-containing protein [Spirochaetales bacterium]
MGLTEVTDGKKVVISHIDGGRGARKKLMDLGMIPGVPVTILRRCGHNPMLLSVMGRQVILGRGMAEKVFVR